jgi:hypothetical protein
MFGSIDVSNLVENKVVQKRINGKNTMRRWKEFNESGKVIYGS